MIKLIIFDLDGVLVDAREIHFESLNHALSTIDSKYVITRKEHLSTYDGLSTRKKLEMLTNAKGLPASTHNLVWQLKQEKTNEFIDNFTQDERVCYILQSLKEQGYIIACATNSIRSTAENQLLKKGLRKFIDIFYTNEDVKKPKPATEMYLKCMIDAGVDPKETLIVEDSFIGREAVNKSGAFLCPVVNTLDLTLEKVNNYINMINQKLETKCKWQSETLNILIPMAGAGSRFAQAGYTFPKPLIDVNGQPMIQVVVDNINIDANYIFIVQEEHYNKYNLQNTLNLIAPGCKIVRVNGITDGAACTTLLAKDLINSDSPLIIANSDQYVEWNSSEFMHSMVADGISGVDAGILTFTSTHPKWSYAKLNEDGFVVEVAEKNPISNCATVGIYYWKRGSDYVKYAESMINKNLRTNNEFYVCPVFNEAILDRKTVKTFNIEKMWGIGTPEDLQLFLQHKK
jgi:HAD superfamily hydrolase (TIGR01509 family)